MPEIPDRYYLYLALAVVAIAQLFLLHFIDGCFLQWFGTEGGALLSTKCKIGATILSSAIIALASYALVRLLIDISDSCATIIFLLFTFALCMLAGTAYYVIL